MEISGYLYLGQSSSRLPAKLHYQEGGQLCFFPESEFVTESSNEPLKKVAIKDVDISSRIGNTPRFISFGDQCQFECADNLAIDELIKTAQQDGYLKTKKYSGLAHRLESKLQFVALTLVLVAVTSWGFIAYGIPFFSEELAHALPAEVSTKIGHGGLEILDKSVFQSSELAEEERDSLRQAFNRIADELTKIEGLELIPMKIEFRKSESIGANAFALPSGTIIFTDEMVKLAENQEQLETIMLHEIGHIAHRHSLRRLIQQSSLALFIVIVTGDISTTSQAILALPGVLLQAGYSQKMELEADDFALKHLQEFGLHPEDFITLMENLESQEKDQGANEPEENIGSVEPKQESEIQGYFSSHPSTSERLERFRNHRH